MRRGAKILTKILIIIGILLPAHSKALDQYPGDTAIYGVSTAQIQPNVLIILDNSGSMNDDIIVGDPYDPSITYPQTNSCQGQPCSTNTVYRWRAIEQIWQPHISDVNTISCATAKNALLTSGTYQGVLRTNGSCAGWWWQSASFATGNYINWLTQAGGTRPKIDVAKEVITNLINTTTGVKFGLMIFNTSSGGHIAGVGDSYGYNGYDAYIKDMDAIFTGTTTNREALVYTLNNIVANTWTPLAETLYEAMMYYGGEETAFNGNLSYSTPIEYSCQNNYVILITDGMSTQDRDSILRTICNSGDCDGDGFEPGGDPEKDYSYQGSDYLDDVAKYMYDNDVLQDVAGDPKTQGVQRVVTYTIGFGLAGQPGAEKLLHETAQNGGGVYYSAGSTAGLSEALRQIFANIIEDNTSFVSPVLPVSPENRTFSGSRLYMGFFKPQLGAFWLGNLKKYGIDDDGNVVDKNGNLATNADGSIKDNAVSYWSSVADGGDVDAGGVGERLLLRTTERNIYTYLGTSTNLADSSNAFTTSNTAITPTLLDVTDSTEKDRVVNYVHGKDAYDSDSNGNTTEKRGWILGDILHSVPLVVHYATFNTADESDCTQNKTMIFVGANDGMLHLFRDCDGEELWAFIPPDLLPYLKHLSGNTHTYYVDGTPVAYMYDADNDGNIETADGDKVIVMFGERRGGRWYYALDVSDPNTPQFLWRIGPTESPSGDNTDYSELGESWSTPEIVNVEVDSGGQKVTKVVAFIGAGYDNINEDTEPPTTNTMGRGVYAVEIATLSLTGVPSFTNSGHKVWGYTNAEDTDLTHSIPSRIATVDIDADGFVERLYVGDTEGNMWRFDVANTDTTTWSGRIIFKSNPGADASTGRKIFYKPAVTLEVGYELIVFGTGDRAHPLSTDVVDRLYAVKDVGQTTHVNETDLSDATNGSVNIYNSYGWYIKLNDNAGEKMLSEATVISKVAYFTTYAPSAETTTDPCNTSANRGTARLYAIDYLTTEAAYNYNTANDTTDGVVKDASDRSKTIGTGIPSGVVMVISPSGISALIGVGGALATPEVSEMGSVIPVYWREIR